jgi:hypothetical protein
MPPTPPAVKRGLSRPLDSLVKYTVSQLTTLFKKRRLSTVLSHNSMLIYGETDMPDGILLHFSRKDFTMADCPCQAPLRADATDTRQGIDYDRRSFGTVLDGTTALAGIVTDAGGSTITVEALDIDGTHVTATLEPAHPNLFNGIAVNDFVYCAVILQELPHRNVARGVCFWIQKFGVSRGSVRSEISLKISNIVTTYGYPAAQAESLSKGLAAALEQEFDSGTPACTIAAMKAVINSGFTKLAMELIAEGYLPVGYECSWSAPNAKFVGYVLVLFRFRNAAQHERTIAVAVKLSTWIAADGLTSEVGDVREVPNSLAGSKSNCVSVTINDRKACLNIPYAGSICVSVPNGIPNGTAARACYKTCSKFGVVCGVKVWIEVLGEEVASDSWGCC